MIVYGVGVERSKVKVTESSNAKHIDGNSKRPTWVCTVNDCRVYSLDKTVVRRRIHTVNWRHIRLIDLVSAKGKTKVNWLISFHSLIRQRFNILIRHCNPSRIRNIKIELSKQLYHNNTLTLFFPLPKHRSVGVTSVDWEIFNSSFIMNFTLPTGWHSFFLESGQLKTVT